MMEWNELSLFASSFLALYAIARRIIVTVARRQRVEGESLAMMLRASWVQFRADGLRGDEIILSALLLPSSLLTIYFFLLVLPLPAFDTDITLHQTIVRPSIFTSNVVLAIYFLNGRLTRVVRSILNVWKRHSPTS